MDQNRQNYYIKGRTDGSKYNFSLEPLIQDFGFFDFILSAETPDHGGFLVITNNQYIIGYNAGFGEGAHHYAMARCMKDIKGGGIIRDDKEVFLLNYEVQTKCIYARIVYEIYEDEMSHQKVGSGYIVFPFCGLNNQNKHFSSLEYEQFLKFYADYNEELKYITKKFDFQVSYTYYDEDNLNQVKLDDKNRPIIQHNYSMDLDNTLEFIKNHLTDDKNMSIDGEVILQKRDKAK